MGRAGRTDVVGGDDQVLDEVDPSESETHGRVDEASRVTGETLLRREVCSHLTEREHDGKAGDGHDAVGRKGDQQEAQ
jgi:hypothetical protein